MYGYVLKLTGDNVYGWVQLFKNSGSNYEVWSNHVAADNTGNVYAFGEFFNKVNFGSVTLNSGSAGDADFVAKLGPTGNVIWAKQFGPITFGLGYSPNAIAVDGAGAVYLTGTFSGTTSFNPAGGGNLTSAGSNDIFALKLDSNGVYQWALRAGGTGDDRGLGIAVDSFGDVDLTGYIGAGPDTFGDPSHSLTTGTQTAFLWQILQP
jgi:hypothetical protein